SPVTRIEKVAPCVPILHIELAFAAARLAALSEAVAVVARKRELAGAHAAGTREPRRVAPCVPILHSELAFAAARLAFLGEAAVARKRELTFALTVRTRD